MIPYGHQSVGQDDIDAVIDVLKSDWLTTGPTVEKFEAALCEYTGAHHAVAVNSATSALDIAIQSLEIPPGSEVISTAFTFAASNNALLYNGLTPVFTDIQHDTRNIDPDDIKRKITSKTRAIMAVDYAGHPCDLDEIQEIADHHDLYLIEDAAHALGAEYKGKKIGTFADATIFSFHPVKPITTGEGGAVMTENPDLAERLRILRTHGINKGNDLPANNELSWQYDMTCLGRNYRLTDIQAALGRSQINKLDRFIERRNELAEIYNRELKKISYLELPITRPYVRHGWHLYTVILQEIDRNAFFRYMRAAGIGVNVHYIPTYHLSYYKKHIPVRFTDYPVTEDVFNTIITLPIHPGMVDADMSQIITVLQEYTGT